MDMQLWQLAGTDPYTEMQKGPYQRQQFELDKQKQAFEKQQLEEQSRQLAEYTKSQKQPVESLDKQAMQVLPKDFVLKDADGQNTVAGDINDKAVEIMTIGKQAQQSLQRSKNPLLSVTERKAAANEFLQLTKEKDTLQKEKQKLLEDEKNKLQFNAATAISPEQYKNAIDAYNKTGIPLPKDFPKEYSPESIQKIKAQLSPELGIKVETLLDNREKTKNKKIKDLLAIDKAIAEVKERGPKAAQSLIKLKKDLGIDEFTVDELKAAGISDETIKALNKQPSSSVESFGNLSEPQKEQFLNNQARQENAPKELNNPGAIQYGDFAKQFGAVFGIKNSAGTLAKFPDLETGKKAQRALWESDTYKNKPLNEAIKTWTGNKNEASPEFKNYLGGLTKGISEPSDMITLKSPKQKELEKKEQEKEFTPSGYVEKFTGTKLKDTEAKQVVTSANAVGEAYALKNIIEKHPEYVGRKGQIQQFVNKYIDSWANNKELPDDKGQPELIFAKRYAEYLTRYEQALAGGARGFTVAFQKRFNALMNQNQFNAKGFGNLMDEHINSITKNALNIAPTANRKKLTNMAIDLSEKSEDKDALEQLNKIDQKSDTQTTGIDKNNPLLR